MPLDLYHPDPEAYAPDHDYYGCQEEPSYDYDIRGISNAVNSVSDDADDQILCVVSVQGNNVLAVIDTGAKVNVMPLRIHRTLQCPPPLLPSAVLLHAFGSTTPLHTTGQFHATVATSHASTTATFYVTAEGNDLLIGCKTAKQLQIIAVVCSIAPASPADNVLASFGHLFSGMGKLKGVQVQIDIDSSVRPVALPHRRVPLPMRAQVEQEILHLEQMDIIERVSGPTPWVSPVVLAPKPKKPGAIRLCVDMRLPNTAIRRVRHLTPTIDDIIADLNGATVFSKLDLTAGYHQLELHPSSRSITTFSTHVGLRQYKRLSFGISSAAEIFQNEIQTALAGLQGQLNVSDDILIYATTSPRHLDNLQAVLQRLSDCGLRLNKEKCLFHVASIEFFGYVFSAAGVSPDPNKVKDIHAAPPPMSAAEVRSFLGMAAYCGRFIKDLATLSRPLRDLTKTATPWRWAAEEQMAFNAIKCGLAAEVTLAYFSFHLPTSIAVDASPCGLGAILLQEDQLNTRKTLAFASRALTPTEQRYSQTEREALAITWAVQHFHLYVSGRPLTVITDHKPLTYMFNNPTSKPPARIERWLMLLQHHDLRVVYQPGHSNAADYLSRHPRPPSSTESEASAKTEVFINNIAAAAIPKAITLAEVEQEYRLDDVLAVAMDAQRNNSWQELIRSLPARTPQAQSTLRALSKVRDQLSLTETDMLLKGTRLVMPATLWQRLVQLAHEGHQGMAKCKERLRSCVWFPEMDGRVEQWIKSCRPCNVTAAAPAQLPIVTLPTPPTPWTNLAADFCDLPPTAKILVILDEHSKYPVTHILRSTKASDVIPALHETFAALGTPHVLKTDNGPPFQSQAFAAFAEMLGFHHRKITPYWPQANGEVERFMRTLKKCLQIAQLTNTSTQQAITDLLWAYRSTPHCTTGMAPATALLGRPMKDKLPMSTALRASPLDASKVSATRLANNDKATAARKAPLTNLLPGDTVLLRRDSQDSKVSSRFHPEEWLITAVKGTMISATNGHRSVARNASFFQRVSPQRLPPAAPRPATSRPELSRSATTPPWALTPSPLASLGSAQGLPARAQPGTPQRGEGTASPDQEPPRRPDAQQKAQGRPPRERRPPPRMKDYYCDYG